MNVLGEWRHRMCVGLRLQLPWLRPSWPVCVTAAWCLVSRRHLQGTCVWADARAAVRGPGSTVLVLLVCVNVSLLVGTQGHVLLVRWIWLGDGRMRLSSLACRAQLVDQQAQGRYCQCACWSSMYLCCLRCRSLLVARVCVLVCALEQL